MRRDAGCGERDSRNVEGRQGHEAGGTIDADGMRPLHENGAVTSRCNRSLRGLHPASDCTVSFRGPTGRGSSWGQPVRCGVVPFASLLPGIMMGQAFNCCACGRAEGGAVETPGGGMREHS